MYTRGICLRTAALTSFAAAFIDPRFPDRRISTKRSKLRSSFKEPSSHDSNFGRREYWNEFYKSEEEFSWYTGWEDLEPFVRDLVPCEKSHILIPGVGSDRAIVDMYDAGYQNLTAFDYAKAGEECSRKLLGDDRVREEGEHHSPGVILLVADARNLPFEDSSFDAVLDKGTLDAIYLSGGRDKKLAAEYLNMAVSELSRVLTKDGIVISVTAACTDAIQSAFDSFDVWKQIRDGTPYITEDGFASNNVDATLLAWTIAKKQDLKYKDK